MSRLGLLLLVLLAIGLATTLFAEWHAAELDAQQDLRQADLAARQSVGTKSGEAATRKTDPPAALAALQSEQLESWLQTTLARPLFEAGRRPSKATASQPKIATAPRLPRLAGVLISKDRRQVIFAGSDGKPIIVGEGTAVDGFMVQSIAAGQVTVVGPDGPQVLHPTFDPDHRPPPPPAPLPVAAPPIIPGLPGVQPNVPGFTQRGQLMPPPSQ
jgi:hypothetical protein